MRNSPRYHRKKLATKGYHNISPCNSDLTRRYFFIKDDNINATVVPFPGNKIVLYVKTCKCFMNNATIILKYIILIKCIILLCVTCAAVLCSGRENNCSLNLFH